MISNEHIRSLASFAEPIIRKHSPEYADEFHRFAEEVEYASILGFVTDPPIAFRLMMLAISLFMNSTPASRGELGPVLDLHTAGICLKHP